MKEKFKNGEGDRMDPRAAAFATQSKEKFERCRKCSMDEEGLWGTPLSVRDVHAVLSDNTRIVVARVTQCLRCGQVYKVRMFNAAGEHEVYEAHLEACVKETRGSVFTLEELQTDRVNPGPAFPDKADTIKDMGFQAHADASGGTRQPEPAVELW